MILLGVLAGFLSRGILNGGRTEAAKSLPVLIQDEQRRTVGSSSGGSLEQVLAENNVKIFPEDKVSAELILDPIKDGSAGEKITIKRAPVFWIKVDGDTIVARSWAETVQDVLAGKVTLGLKDIVNPRLNSLAVPGEINITRINVIETEEVVNVPFSTTEKPDYYVAKGAEKVITAGVNGKKTRLLSIRYKNGVEESRRVISETVTQKPVTKVVKVGLMPSNQRYFNRTYWDWMVQAGTKYGVSPLALFDVASCESRVNPKSISRLSNGYRYWGMYQYQSSGSAYSGGLFSTNAKKLGFSPMAWDDAKAQIFVTAYIVSNEGGWRRWGCKP